MKKKTLQRTIFCSVIAVNMGCASVFANDDLQKFSLANVIVTASREAKKDIDVPAMTQVYTAEDIENAGANDVMDFMKNILGAEIIDTTAPAKNGVHFRGTGSASRMRTSALILVDGVPINIQGRADISTIPASVIQKIEVINGGGSVLYGTDALDGGVINIILKKEFDKQISGGYGTHGKRLSDITYGSKINADKETAFNFAYSHNQLKERGHNDILGDSNDPTKIRYGGKYDSDSFVMKTTPVKNLNILAMHKSYSNDYYYRNAKNSYSDPHPNSELYNINYNNKDLNVNTYWKKYRLKIDTTENGIKQQTTDNSSRVFGLDVNNKFKFKMFSVLIGTNFENEQISQTLGKYSRNQNTGAGYFLVDAPISNKTKLSFGGRQLIIEDLGHEFCPQFNILHKLTEKDSIFVNVNKAYRTPLAEELFGNANHGYTGNLDLRPEVGWLSEIGYKKDIRNGNIKLALYNMNINDRIARDKTKAYVNKDKFKNTGIELTIAQRLSNLWSYNLGFTYSNPQEATDGIWEQADYKLGMTSQFSYQVNKFIANLNCQYWDKMADVNNSAINFNVNFKYSFNKNHSVKVNILNFADSDKAFCDTGSLPKRSISAIYTYNF